MFNERNQRIKEAGPSEPVLILGLNGAPAAGDTFHVIEKMCIRDRYKDIWRLCNTGWGYTGFATIYAA